MATIEIQGNQEPEDSLVACTKVPAFDWNVTTDDRPVDPVSRNQRQGSDDSNER